MKYIFEKNGFIFPPRPEFKCPPGDLDKYDNGEYFGQPKYNGCNYEIYTNGDEVRAFNRHKEYLPLLSKTTELDFRGMATTGNWFCYAGEFLNKGKYGETGVKEKNKFVIWEILVYDGEYLIGSTTAERIDLLESLYPCRRSVVNNAGILEQYEHLCCTDLQGIYKTPTYLGDFKKLYQSISKTDLYEGLVLKKKDSKLAFGLQEKNNTDWQIKCRKVTKNYQF